MDQYASVASRLLRGHITFITHLGAWLQIPFLEQRRNNLYELFSLLQGC